MSSSTCPTATILVAPATSVSSQGSGKKGKGKKVAVLTPPVSVGQRLSTGVPRIRGSGSGVAISHREFVLDIASNGVAFQAYSFDVNPALSALFPWLNTIAMQYETYRFRRLQFEYQPQCSTATGGSVVMAMDYDAADAVPTTKAQIMSFAGAVRANAWSPVTLTCDQANLARFGTQRFTRGGAVPSGTDIKTYDQGKLTLALTGVPTVTCGELYVSYDVEFFTPQLDPDVLIKTRTARISGGSGLVGSHPFMNGVVTGGLPVEVILNGAALRFVQTGTYLLSLALQGTGLANTAPELYGTLSDGSAGSFSPLGFTVNATSTLMLAEIVLNITKADASHPADLGFLINATTLASSVLRIAPFVLSLT